METMTSAECRAAFSVFMVHNTNTHEPVIAIRKLSHEINAMAVRSLKYPGRAGS